MSLVRGLLYGVLAIVCMGRVQARELAVTETAGAAGDTVHALVTLNDAAGVASAAITLNYDPQLLRVMSVDALPGSLGEQFLLDWSDDPGVLDIALFREDQLASGSGVLARVAMQINVGGIIGMGSGLTVAQRSLGNESGGSIEWREPVTHTDGHAWVAASDAADSDGDGLTDREEQYLNGSGDYTPGEDGGDTDIGNPDTDGDGMYDGWEVGHGLNALADGRADDTDHDGMRDTAEWIAGTRPNDRTDLMLLTPVAIAAGQPSLLQWQSRTGRHYRVLCSTNCTDWIPITQELDATGNAMSVTGAPPVTASFYALEVHWQPSDTPAPD